MNEKGYTPYCGSECCRKGMPRTQFSKIKKQFFCACGWTSQFPNSFIDRYISKWNIQLSYKGFQEITANELEFKRPSGYHYLI